LPEETYTFVWRCYGRRDRRHRIRWQDFPTVPDEHQTPFYNAALRAPESVVLESEQCHGFVPVHLHQRHVGVAHHTKHRAHSLTNINFGRLPLQARKIITRVIKNV
jgi:hypothetical protein